MAVDPRKFSVKACDNNGVERARRVGKKKSFLEGLGKVGDLEVLNKVGYGKVGEGLRTLSATSDSIRDGTGSKTNILKFGGANGPAAVADEVGQNISDVPRVAEFNPGAANRALGQYEAISDKVSAGNFELSDIPEVFSDLQNFGDLVDGIFPGFGADSTPVEAFCGASPYATSLIRHAPKFQFLFVVQVTFNEPYQDAFKDFGNTMAFVVKHSTRPQVEFEYEEVNQYNFWTRIPKRSVFPPMTMRFYDDTGNNATNFQLGYMNAMSPITNMGGRKGDNSIMTPDYLAAHSMAPGVIQNDALEMQHRAASMGTLAPASGGAIPNLNILKEIKLFHVIKYGAQMNVHTFHNPKILSFNNSELDMAESGGGCEMEFQFAYDALYTESGYSLEKSKDEYKIDTLSSDGHKEVWKIDPVFNAQTEAELKGNAPPSQDKNILVKVGGTITGVVSEVIDGASGLVSKAFDAVDNFAGSIFK